MTERTTHYRISEAARLAGVSASTLRLWENQGLIVSERTVTGQRYYTAAHLTLLKRIVWMRRVEGLNAPAIRAALVVPNAEPKAEMPPAFRSADVGWKLRTLRQLADRTLKQVANDLDITVSTLSTFERTSRGVSFKTLNDLARYYDTTVAKLSGERERQGDALVRFDSWRTRPQTTPGVTVQILAEGRRKMDCHRFVLAPGATSNGSHGHEGEEFVHIVAGRLEISLDQSESYDLHPGDSLYFESSRLHAWINRHDGETIVLWINTPRHSESAPENP